MEAGKDGAERHSEADPEDGGFDNTNVDSEFNLDQMVQMQDNAAERQH